ncbi:hypothetical protein LPJ66_006046, partial [Kickxella alabastrina]
IATLALTMALPSQFTPRYNRRADDLEVAIYDELVDAFALDPVISAALDGNVDISGGDVAGVTDSIANINAMAPAALQQHLCPQQHLFPQQQQHQHRPQFTTKLLQQSVMHWHQLLHRLLHLLLSLCQYQWLHLYQYQWLHLYQYQWLHLYQYQWLHLYQYQWLHLYQYQWLNLYQYRWLHLYQLLHQ